MDEDETSSSLRRRLGETRRIWSSDRSSRKEVPEFPCCQIDEPRPDTTLERGFVHVSGWALTANGPVDRIEMSVNGEPAARARLGVARQDLPETFNTRESVFGGFHCVLDLSDLPASVESVTITGTATGNGMTFDLPTLERRLRDRDETIDPDPGRSALLRDRARLTHLRSEPASGRAREDRLSNPRILAITHNIALGGGQLVMLELLQRFAGDFGMTGTVVAPKDGATRNDLEEAGYAVHVTGAFPVDDIETYEAKMAELIAWAAPQDFDLVLINTVLAFPGGDLAKRLGLPAVWIVHESYGLEGFWATFEEGGLDPYVRERGSRAFREAEAIIFEVDSTLELFRRSAGEAALLTLPYGIDIEAHDAQMKNLDRAEVRARLGYEPDQFVILCMGTLEPRKGQIQLVEAFSRIAADHPQARLVLVGALDNEYDQKVEEAAELFGVGGQVDIHRVTPDIATFYVAADILVCASDIESLPRTVLEAMAFRLPVMATGVFGLPEVIEDGVTGWIVEPRDTAALSHGLVRAIGTGPKEREAIAAAARLKVEDEHDSAVCTARYAEVVRDVIAGHDPDAADPDA